MESSRGPSAVGAFAWHFDADLLRGSSGASATFANPTLAPRGADGQGAQGQRAEPHAVERAHF